MIKRFFLLFFLHILAISLILITHPKAEESEWYVKEFGNYIITGVNGEVSHGDRLRFAIKKNDCDSNIKSETFYCPAPYTSITEMEITQLSNLCFLFVGTEEGVIHIFEKQLNFKFVNSIKSDKFILQN